MIEDVAGHGLTHGPFSAMLKGLVETMTQSLEKGWCIFSPAPVAEPDTPGIQIPALKFTVKENCRALQEGPRTLVDLQCARRFGIKIVGISVRGDEGTLSSRNYPGAKDKLKAGSLVKTFCSVAVEVPYTELHQYEVQARL